MRKIDEEKFLYSVSEESIMKTWDSETIEDHEFSDAYKNFREDLIRKAGETGTIRKSERPGVDMRREEMAKRAEKSSPCLT